MSVEVGPRTGWAQRQAKRVRRNIYEWPEWMRRNEGIKNPERCAVNDLRTAIRRALKLFSIKPEPKLTLTAGASPAEQAEIYRILKNALRRRE